MRVMRVKFYWGKNEDYNQGSDKPWFLLFIFIFSETFYFMFLNNIRHVLMPFSQIIPTPHRVQKTVLYICVSFAVSYTGLLLPSF